MPGHRRRGCAAFCAPHPPCRHTRDQHHRLGVGGQRQRFLGAFLDQQTNIFAQGIRGFLQGLSHHRVVAPAVEHAHGLRALPRKDKCKRLHDNIQNMNEIRPQRLHSKRQ